MTAIREAASDFLAHKRIAVTGVSRNAGAHASNAVYQRLRSKGYEVFPVNPNADEVEGDPCYQDLKSIPGGVEAVVIGTRPEHADGTMRECSELGIRKRMDASSVRVWQRVRFGNTLRPRAQDNGDRRRLSVDVRPLLGWRPQGHACHFHNDRKGPKGSLTVEHQTHVAGLVFLGHWWKIGGRRLPHSEGPATVGRSDLRSSSARRTTSRRLAF